MKQSGFDLINMKERLRRSGVHPKDIEIAANFVTKAIEQDTAHGGNPKEAQIYICTGGFENERPKK